MQKLWTVADAPNTLSQQIVYCRHFSKLDILKEVEGKGAAPSTRHNVLLSIYNTTTSYQYKNYMIPYISGLLHFCDVYGHLSLWTWMWATLFLWLNHNVYVSLVDSNEQDIKRILIHWGYFLAYEVMSENNIIQNRCHKY